MRMPGGTGLRLSGQPVVTVMGITAMLAVTVAGAAMLVPAPAHLMYGAAAMLAVDIAGIGAATGTARRCRGTERVAFACVAAIFALWAATRIIWLGGLVSVGEMPEDLVALRMIWGGVAVLGVATVILLYVHHREGPSWAGPLDAAVVTLALAFLLWDLYFSGGDLHRVEALSATAYFALIGGIATVAAAMALWRRSSVHRWLRWAILALVPLAGDMALGIAATWTDNMMLRVYAMAVGLLALGCIITMVLVRREEPASPAPTVALASAPPRRSRVTRAMSAAAILGIVTAGVWDDGLVGLLAVLAVTLLIVRVAISQRTVEQLLDQRSRWALTDPLTGVHNRRLFEHELSVLDARMRRHAVPASIIALDLDRFKGVNDTHGHGVGDVLLREVATALTGILREGDQLFRLGGDEFIALLPSTAGVDAERIGNRLRLAVAAAAARVLPDGPAVTASVGIAEVPTGEAGAKRGHEAADGALYAAKARGRNRVVTAPPLDRVAQELVSG